MKMYKLMESDGRECFLIHTKNLTKEEAEQMLEHHADLFPESEWWIEPHDEEDDIEEEPRRYNNNAVDGWEDLFNYDD